MNSRGYQNFVGSKDGSNEDALSRNTVVNRAAPKIEFGKSSSALQSD